MTILNHQHEYELAGRPGRNVYYVWLEDGREGLMVGEDTVVNGVNVIGWETDSFTELGCVLPREQLSGED